MRNGNVFEAVYPASVGGEYPQRLGTIIAVDCPSALCPFLCPDLAQDAAIDLPSHNLIGVIARGDDSAFAVNNVASDLHRR
jgi:hypothetical protein